MADTTPPAGDGTPPAGDGNTPPSDEAKNTLKALIKESFAEWVEENKPAPSRTEKKGNFLDQILGFGK